MVRSQLLLGSAEKKHGCDDDRTAQDLAHGGHDTLQEEQGHHRGDGHEVQEDVLPYSRRSA